MDGGHDLAASRRLVSLVKKFHSKLYRDSYVASHMRGVLAQQMRQFRGNRSQAEYAEKVGKQKTVIGRLESPGYAGWSLRTMLEIARKENVAVFVRFVDFPTFLKYTDDLSDNALRPQAYDTEAMNELVRAEERSATDGALKALFSRQPEQQRSNSARNAVPPPQPAIRSIAANDDAGTSKPTPEASQPIGNRLAEAAD